MLNNPLRTLKGDLKRAGIELSAQFDMKGLRKSFAQNAANAGVPPRTLADLMGHSDVKVTMTYYNRVTDANKREAAKAINRLLAPAASQEKADAV
ncbi:MAG: hypothetical protein C4547_14385 [Phycisphaerales bacterium]|nr:MAG: hypothetical protein C4547_14385 [Phycisphaerales bacterium]